MTGPGDRRIGPRRSDREPPSTLQDTLNDADRRHRERRQYDADPSGWDILPNPRYRCTCNGETECEGCRLARETDER